jgi:hypothetical protein
MANAAPNNNGYFEVSVDVAGGQVRALRLVVCLSSLRLD